MTFDFIEQKLICPWTLLWTAELCSPLLCPVVGQPGCMKIGQRMMKRDLVILWGEDK